jgi:hypothetical protein
LNPQITVFSEEVKPSFLHDFFHHLNSIDSPAGNHPCWQTVLITLNITKAGFPHNLTTLKVAGNDIIRGKNDQPDPDKKNEVPYQFLPQVGEKKIPSSADADKRPLN